MNWFPRWLAFILSCAFVVSACSSMPGRMTTNTVNVPTAVSCFDPAKVPQLPAKTPVDIEGGAADQLAAATALDAENFERYSKLMVKFLAQCSQALPPPAQPTGGKT